MWRDDKEMQVVERRNWFVLTSDKLFATKILYRNSIAERESERVQGMKDKTMQMMCQSRVESLEKLGVDWKKLSLVTVGASQMIGRKSKYRLRLTDAHSNAVPQVSTGQALTPDFVRLVSAKPYLKFETTNYQID
ncbi:hypothetical protein RF11_14994 [Thelohanellus kitauei]|uniref:Uncharacterized protein n=1 Tax=Thelohanellus kitauei TaxID=669202 RepID=A0A0C2MQ42_THEKT|nr:hypothetical protein RF11_14994 [Thelohanellus kitauei]